MFEGVLARPDDAARRLVFADWLEEQGDSQAELIRVQLRLSNPTLGTENERAEWKLRESGLLWRHRRRWNGRLHRFLSETPLRGQVGSRRSLVRRWEYGRGFVETLEVEFRAVLEFAELLFQLGPLRQLRLFHFGSAVYHYDRSRQQYSYPTQRRLEELIERREEQLARLESLVLPHERFAETVRSRPRLSHVKLLIGLRSPELWIGGMVER